MQMRNIWKEWNKKCIIVFLGIICIFLLVNIMTYRIWGDNFIIPFNNSPSFNMKIYEIKKMHKYQFDCIAIGSSMTLNNLASKPLAEILKNKNESFHNFSSWGLDIAAINHYAKCLVQVYHPQKIIIFSNVVDFNFGGPKEPNYDDLSKYLNNENEDFLLFIKNKTILRNSYSEYAQYKNKANDYSCLNYDENGGVLLNVYGENISKLRWNEKSSYNFKQHISQYEHLKDIAAFCKDNGILLYFVQVPNRRFWVDDQSIIELEKHYEYCKDIIEKSGNIYYKAVDYDKYTDELFADVTHLNASGAQLLTREFIDNCLIR